MNGAPGHDESVYSVSELTAEIKGLLETSFGRLWVEGEISNFRPAASGHWYFTLKDDAASLPIVMFRRANGRVRFDPEDGAAVRIFGAISVYAPHGRYQLIAERMEEVGLGALQRAFEELKRRLHAEGLFDEDRKQELPLVPKRVGVVTSPTGAAIRDILNVLGRRFPGLPVLIAPARVQGDQAPEEVAAAIRALDARGDVDVMIVGRGGGSLEDLWAFNTEVVARAIFAAETPIISAVGHEIDFTISDMVADLRAPTPSAAAELVCQSRDAIEDQLRGAARDMTRVLERRLSDARARIRHAERLLQDPRRAIDFQRQRLDDLASRMAPPLVGRMREGRSDVRSLGVRLHASGPRPRIASGRTQLGGYLGRMATALRTRRGYARKDLEQLSGKLLSLDPYAVLERGYSVAFDAEGRVLRDAEAVKEGAAVRVRLHRGELDAEVTGVRPAKPNPSTTK